MLCLRLQRGGGVRGWGLTAWERGRREGGARAWRSVDVDYALWVGLFGTRGVEARASLRSGLQNLDHDAFKVPPLTDRLCTQPLSQGPVQIEGEHELDVVG